MALIADLQPFILPEVQEASLPLIDSMARRKLRDFCSRTKVWKSSITPLNTVANTQSYTMTPPAESEIVRIETVRYNGMILDPTTEEELDDEYHNWTAMTGDPKRYFTRDGITLSLFPLPSAIGQITARVTLKPAAATLQYPDMLYSKYLDAIVAGIKADLMLMPNVAWHNASVGAVYESAYEASIGNGSVDAFRGMSRARRGTTPQFF